MAIGSAHLPPRGCGDLAAGGTDSSIFDKGHYHTHSYRSVDNTPATGAPQNSQDRRRFFDEHCASKDDDGCDDADGLQWMRVTLLKEPLCPFDCAKDPKDQSDGQ